MHRELEQRPHHRDVAVRVAGGDGVEPARHRRLVVPAHAVPARHAVVVRHPHRAGGVALHDGGAQHLGEHHEVALGAGGPVEHHPLVGARRGGGPPSSTGRRRTAASRRGRWPGSAPRVISSWVAGRPAVGSVVGATTTPELTTRRSWTCGRRARSISSSTSPPDRIGGSGAWPTSSSSSATRRRSRAGTSTIPPEATDGVAQLRRHLPGHLGEDVPVSRKRLEVGQHGGPAAGRLVAVGVGEVLVGDGEADDLARRARWRR